LKSISSLLFTATIVLTSGLREYFSLTSPKNAYPISKDVTTLDYQNSYWSPSQPPPLQLGYYDVFITAEFDLKRLRIARKNSRNFQQRRPELYKEIIKSHPIWEDYNNIKK